MSAERAQQIVDFIELGKPTKFCNVHDASDLMSLAKMAYRALRKQPPFQIEDLLNTASQYLDRHKERIGLKLSESRAEDLVRHLLNPEKETDPHFRQKDDIATQRELFRKALAIVARIEEEGNGSKSHLIVGGESIIEKRYPLHPNE